MTRTSFALVLLGAALITAACSNGPGDAFGDLLVVTHTDGAADPDGYMVKIGQRAAVPIGDSDSVRVNNLPIGNYSVVLSGVAAGCAVTNGDSQTVYVPVGEKKFTMEIVCP